MDSCVDLGEFKKAYSGYVEADSLYTLEEFQGRLRLGKQAWRTARAQGLPVRVVGRRKYVLGVDALQWMQAQPVDLN